MSNLPVHPLPIPKYLQSSNIQKGSSTVIFKSCLFIFCYNKTIITI